MHAAAVPDPGDGGVLERAAFGGQPHDPGPFRIPRRRTLGTYPPLQLPPISLGDHHGCAPDSS